MRKAYLILFLVALASFPVVGIAQGQFDVTESQEKKISKILKSLSLEEKVGQTCQITLDAILKTAEKGGSLEPAQIDEEKLKIAFEKYHVGSLLNVSSHTLSLEEWETILAQIKVAEKKYKLEIPIIYGIDAIHGVNYTIGATLFPQEIGLAATWNRDVALQFGNVVAYESRATGLKWNFSPVLDLGRQPLWSRFFETMGEDPFLCSELGQQIIQGYQGGNQLDDYHVASCLKHFVGYSAPFSGRDRTPAWIPQKYMTELYLPAFERAVKSGAMTLMINSGDVNGIPGHANKHLLTEVLKNEWGFKGFTVSDWEDFIMLQTVHDVSASLQEAIVLAFNSGVDMSMVPYNPQYKEYCELMIKAVCEKQISMERLDDAVRRILRVKMAIGLYDKESATEYPKFGSQEHKEIAKNAALESITLLKNENAILPLQKSAKVLVAGPTANNLTFLNGAWTHTWQGVDTSYNTKGCNTIIQAFENKVGSENCAFSPGAELFFDTGWETTKLLDTKDLEQKAKSCDVIVLCLGEPPATEKPGDIRSLNLSPEQLELAKIAYETNKPVILVLVEGRPRILHPIVDGAAAILQCYLPGDYGADALVDIIYGDVNPSGKLPYTYPKYDGVIEFYDRQRSVDRSGKSNQFDAFDPEWEFGFGLSYTTFSYSELTINKTEITSADSISISVVVENTGAQKGKEVVQLYVSDKKASIVPAGKRLKNFVKIELTPKEKKKVNFTISSKELQFANQNGEWILEPGTFKIEIGGQIVEFELKKG